MKFLLASLLVMASWAMPATAHQPGHGAYRAVVTPPTGLLQGIIVQVHETLAPQVVLEYTGTQTLEILDDQGRPFIRIGPDGVQGDQNATAWYLTYSTATVPLPDSALDADAPANWRTVRAEPSWGWFDPRVNPKRAENGLREWQIPVRVGGKPAAIRGRFEAKPRWRGRLEARLTATTLPEGLSLQMVQGAPPAVLAQYRGQAPLLLLGQESEPYLRLSTAGVEANLRSETWRRYGRNQNLPLPQEATEEPVWALVSRQPSYTWLEPRADYTGKEPRAGSPRKQVKTWSLPLRVGDQELTLQGTIHWIPEAPQAHPH